MWLCRLSADAALASVVVLQTPSLPPVQCSTRHRHRWLLNERHPPLGRRVSVRPVSLLRLPSQVRGTHPSSLREPRAPPPRPHQLLADPVGTLPFLPAPSESTCPTRPPPQPAPKPPGRLTHPSRPRPERFPEPARNHRRHPGHQSPQIPYPAPRADGPGLRSRPSAAIRMMPGNRAAGSPRPTVASPASCSRNRQSVVAGNLHISNSEPVRAERVRRSPDKGPLAWRFPHCAVARRSNRPPARGRECDCT